MIFPQNKNIQMYEKTGNWHLNVYVSLTEGVKLLAL